MTDYITKESVLDILRIGTALTASGRRLTMTEYINREQAIKLICGDRCGCHHYECGRDGENCRPIELIKSVPAADVAPVVHGEWVQYETYELTNGDLVGEAYCSKCELYSTQISPDGRVSYDFCPRCQAKMDGGADNE